MRRAYAAVAASVVLVLLTVVVASAADARSEKATVTTVTLSGWSAGKTEDNLLQSVVDDFDNTHPNINVDYSVINGDYATAMTARFAAHNPPDVFYVDSSVAPTWVEQGVLAAAEQLHQEEQVRHEQVLSRACSTRSRSGKHVYGFPKDWSPLAMEINNGDARQGARSEGADRPGRS